MPGLPRTATRKIKFPMEEKRGRPCVGIDGPDSGHIDLQQPGRSQARGTALMPVRIIQYNHPAPAQARERGVRTETA
jgi:hypothetical protein